MKTDNKPTEVSVEFIRLFFPSPEAEEVAVKCARLLASLVGDRAILLRPETTLSEMFGWLQARRSLVEFVIALETELGFELDEFLVDFDHLTFRELVEHASQRQTSAT